ncbi:class I SAM-dependent methyltransferase, partial [Candidatus Roizmanbacteria bacterium]|nr:class I SAM-dependent methyltransferase [Candidatus Roizmanbacteria bacterium]
MINQLCAICDKNNYEILYPENFDIKKINSRIFSARRLPDRIHYRIVKCKNDGLVYSNRILEYDKIEKLYKKSFTSYDEHLVNLRQTYGHYLKELKIYTKEQVAEVEGIPSARRSGDIHRQSSTDGKETSDRIWKTTSKKNLLEIGCGNGFFLEEAARQGYKAYGIEPGKQSVNKAKPEVKKNIVVDIFKPGQFKKNFFDVICSLQTFDHVPDPNGMLKECYKILKQDGLMLFFNHDIGAWQNKLMGEKSPIIDIEHTYLFDKKTMRIIFEKHKFNVIEVKSAFNIHHLSYWIHLLPIPNAIKI